MVYGKTLLTAAIAAVAFAGLDANVASAATINFNTTGTFVTALPQTDSNAAANIVTIGDSTLTFTGSTVASNAFQSGNNFSNVPSLPFTFGSFNLTSLLQTPPDFFNTTTFTLSLQQSAPTPSPATPAILLATLDGTITTSSDGVIITFANPVAAFTVAGVGTYTYTIDAQEIVGIGSTVTIGGRINVPAGAPTAVPLPPAAFGGAGLCGLMFGFRRLKQRFTAAV